MVLLGAVARTSAVEVEGFLTVLGVNYLDEAETEWARGVSRGLRFLVRQRFQDFSKTASRGGLLAAM
jgi:hypothetical protein